MRIIIKATNGKKPFVELKNFVNGFYLIQDTDQGKVLSIHGTENKNDSIKAYTFMKNHISLKNIDYILTCYPKTMIKLIKELNIDIKRAKILFPKHNGQSFTSYCHINDDVIAGYGITKKKALKAEFKALKKYEKTHNMHIENKRGIFKEN